MSGNLRERELDRLDELPRRVSSRRAPEVSKKDDWEIDFFHHVDILRRHLKPLLRFLIRQVGREWVAVAPEVERRCRRLPIRHELKQELLAALRKIGAAKHPTYSLLYSRVVYVDPQTGRLRRGDGLLD